MQSAAVYYALLDIGVEFDSSFAGHGDQAIKEALEMVGKKLTRKKLILVEIES